MNVQWWKDSTKNKPCFLSFRGVDYLELFTHNWNRTRTYYIPVIFNWCAATCTTWGSNVAREGTDTRRLVSHTGWEVVQQRSYSLPGPGGSEACTVVRRWQLHGVLWEPGGQGTGSLLSPNHPLCHHCSLVLCKEWYCQASHLYHNPYPPATPWEVWCLLYWWESALHRQMLLHKCPQCPELPPLGLFGNLEQHTWK